MQHPYSPGRPLLRATSALLVAALLVLPQLADAKPKGPAATARKGEEYYTQFSLYFEKGCHITTNYRRGALLPVNSPVTFLKAGGNKITVKLSSGQELLIHNVKDYSGEDLDGIFSRTLSKTKLDLAHFNDQERASIAQGQVAPGMTKKAVLAAMGYPPKHKTPSLEANQWRYWSSRFGNLLVSFADDKVSKIEK